MVLLVYINADAACLEKNHNNIYTETKANVCVIIETLLLQIFPPQGSFA